MNNDILEELGARKTNTQRLLDNMQAKIDATKMLKSFDDDSELRQTLDGLDEMIKKLEKIKVQREEEKKDYASIETSIKNIKKGLNDIGKDNSAKDNAKALSGIVKEIEKLDSKNISEDITQAFNDFAKAHKNAITIAQDYTETLKKEAKTLEQVVEEEHDAFKSSLSKAKKVILDLSNAFNLQKLVGGGIDLKDLNRMQGNVKVSMNLDNTEFLGLQRKLVANNDQINEMMENTYFTFSDTVSYLSSIKDYSFKNYNQSIALYKQVMVGNKYLGLSNQSLSSMVKATNQLADDSYMNRQMAILSALGNDSGIAENMESLAQFSAENIAGLSARYNNPQDVMANSLAGLSVADTYLGNNASLVHSLMAEIMNASDFSNLSDQTQMLLSIASANGGVSVGEITQMMRTGNMEGINRIIQGTLEGTYNFSRRAGGSTTLDRYGLGQWNTTASAFNNNRDEYLRSINDQLKVLSKYDLSTKEGMDKALAELAEQNDNKTFWEKFEDSLFNSLGIQNANWNLMLGLIQMLNSGLAIFTGVTSIMELKDVKIIKHLVSYLAGKKSLDKATDSISPLSSLSSTAKFSIGGTLLAGGLALGGIQAVKTSERGDGWARGAFLGTGYKGSPDNATSLLGNIGKYAMAGGGVGMMLGHPIIGAAAGAVIGLVTGIIGNSLEKNTEAVEDNTKAYKESNDSIARSSYIAKIADDYYKNMEVGGPSGIGGGNSAGTLVGAVGTPTSNYKYGISSHFGDREYYYKGKKVKDFHKGVDFRFPQGTPIGAAQSGTVVGGASGFNGGAGQFLRIRGVDGLDYLYYHLHKRYVNNGDKVTAGDLIALSGGNSNVDGSNAGQSTGAHLHFQVNKAGTNNYLKPYSYVTSQLFNPGSAPSYSTTSSNTSNTEIASVGNITYRLSKESVFSASSPTSGGVGGPINDQPVGNYATSSDVDRLIDVIREVNEVKESQKELMRMLAGQNTFIYGKE